MFHSADGEAVEASSMDESPILKMKVEAGEVPVGAISKLVVGERAGNQGWKKYFIFWDCNAKSENVLQVVDTNPV